MSNFDTSKFISDHMEKFGEEPTYEVVVIAALEAANKRISELEVVSDNCISIGLHDSRMWAAEQRIKELETGNIALCEIGLDRDVKLFSLESKLKIAVEAITELGDRVVEMYPDDLEKWSFEALAQIKE